MIKVVDQLMFTTLGCCTYTVFVGDLSLSVLSFLSLQLWDVVFCVCGGSKFVSLIQWTWIMRRALVYSKPYLHVCIYSTECYRVDFKESFRIFWYSVVSVLLQVLFQCFYSVVSVLLQGGCKRIFSAFFVTVLLQGYVKLN